jgi:tRNA(adenine34) deaminase
MTHPVKKFMHLAIEEAQKAKANGDYAIGAVIVKNGSVLAKGTNRVKLDNDPTHHAEIVAIREATKQLNSRHLEESVLYTTHEPCPMCAVQYLI